jgi:hypothetical protein
MVKKTGRKKGNRPEWTPDRVSVLKKNYPIRNNQEVAEMLKTTVSAVRSAAFIFRLKKKDRNWDKPEETFLLKNWEVMSAVELADHLGKTRWAIINKYRELTGKRKK